MACWWRAGGRGAQQAATAECTHSHVILAVAPGARTCRPTPPPSSSSAAHARGQGRCSRSAAPTRHWCQSPLCLRPRTSSTRPPGERQVLGVCSSSGRKNSRVGGAGCARGRRRHPRLPPSGVHRSPPLPPQLRRAASAPTPTMAPATPKIDVTVFSDIACPYCWIGKKRLDAAVQQLGGSASVEQQWRAFLLDTAFPEGGEMRVCAFVVSSERVRWHMLPCAAGAAALGCTVRPCAQHLRSAEPC